LGRQAVRSQRDRADLSGLSQRDVAKVLGVSQQTVSNDVTKVLSETNQRLVDRDEKETEIRQQNAALKLVKSVPVVDTYGTIVIDPPWEMEKIKRDVAPNQVAFDYPTMTERTAAVPRRANGRGRLSSDGVSLLHRKACRAAVGRP
jgi:hypothetical protein